MTALYVRFFSCVFFTDRPERLILDLFVAGKDIKKI